MPGRIAKLPLRPRATVCNHSALGPGSLPGRWRQRPKVEQACACNARGSNLKLRPGPLCSGRHAHTGTRRAVRPCSGCAARLASLGQSEPPPMAAAPPAGSRPLAGARDNTGLQVRPWGASGRRSWPLASKRRRPRGPRRRVSESGLGGSGPWRLRPGRRGTALSWRCRRGRQQQRPAAASAGRGML